jgi:hypothetical protein
MKRIATAIGIALLLLLAAAAGAYSLTFSPRPAPRTEDLPHVVARVYASTSATSSNSQLASAEPTQPAPPAGPASAVTNGGPSGASTVKPRPVDPASGRPAGSHDDADHEVVSPPVHDSDDHQPDGAAPKRNGEELKKYGEHK